VVRGEAMSDWEYTPIENIAFALQDIVNILERIEKLMPTPEGIISTSEGPVNPNEPKKEEPKKDSE
jgi:hypothetical protein